MNAVIFRNTGKHQEYRHLIKGPEKHKRTRTIENYIGTLFQGIRDIERTDVCLFIQIHEVPQDRNVDYICILYNIVSHKKLTQRVRLTVGGNKPTYNGTVSNPTSDLTTTKLHLNIVLSNPYGKYFIVDFKNFYLNNPMKKAEYYKIAIKFIHEEIIDKYDLKNKQSDSCIYVIVKKGNVWPGQRRYHFAQIAKGPPNNLRLYNGKNQTSTLYVVTQ